MVVDMKHVGLQALLREMLKMMVRTPTRDIVWSSKFTWLKFA